VRHLRAERFERPRSSDGAAGDVVAGRGERLGCASVRHREARHTDPQQEGGIEQRSREDDPSSKIGRRERRGDRRDGEQKDDDRYEDAQQDAAAPALAERREAYADRSEQHRKEGTRQRAGRRRADSDPDDRQDE
jgi:hypothetical protein